MRWNCPHCDELVTAGIDFESTTKAYVRCAHCKGMSLIHRSAVLADYVKARRMDEEAQLETEIRLQKEQSRELQQSIEAQNLHVQALQIQIQQAAQEQAAQKMESMHTPTNEVNVDGRILSSPLPPPMSASAAGIGMTTPPPFVQATIRLQEEILAPAPPRVMPVPPAFLVGNVEEAVRAFATEEAQDSADIFFAETVKAPPASAENSKTTSLRSNLPVWLAAALALASGIFLFHEGKQALAPPAETPSEIQSAR